VQQELQGEADFDRSGIRERGKAEEIAFEEAVEQGRTFFRHLR